MMKTLALCSFLPVIALGYFVLDVEFVMMGYPAPFGLPSLTFHAPPLEIAVAKARQKWNRTLRIQSTIIQDTTVLNALEWEFNAFRMVMKWVYQQMKPDRFSILVLPIGTEGMRIDKFLAEQNVLFVPEDLLTSLLEKFSWTNVFIFVDKDSAPAYTLYANRLIEGGYFTKQLVRYFSSKTTSTFSDFLLDVQNVSRVVLFLANAATLRQLLIEARRLNMTNGDYVYIAFDPVRKIPELYGNLTWDYADQFNKDARQAFGSLLIMQYNERDTIIDPSISHSELKMEVEQLTKKEFNFSYSLTGSTFPIYTQSVATVDIISQVLNETASTEPDFNFSNGIQLAKKFFNRTFLTDVGWIYLDQNGERKSDMTISQFNRFGNLPLAPFLTFRGQSGKLEMTGEIDWIGLWPPLNEPVCGYLGKNPACQAYSKNEAAAIVTVAMVLVAMIAFGACLRNVLKWHDDQKLWFRIDGRKLQWSDDFGLCRLSVGSVAQFHKKIKNDHLKYNM